MKAIMIIALVFSTQAAFSKVEPGTVTKEIWTCKGDGKGYVDSVTVTVDNTKSSSAGSILDGNMSSDAIELNADKKDNHVLTGSIMGHDSRDYRVQLVANSTDVFDSYSDETKTSGQAVVVYGGFIDCVGDVSGAELLTCDVKLERAK